MEEERRRKNPMLYPFAGMQLLVGTYKANGRVDISFKTHEMERVFTMEYKPAGRGEGLCVGEYLPEDIIRQTLEAKLVKFFIPALFAAHPKARNGEIHFSALGQYALDKLHASKPYADEGKNKRQTHLRKMIALWGDMPMEAITPDNCAHALTHSMEASAAKACIALLRRIYPIALAGITADLHVWDRYKQPGRKTTYSPKRRVRTRLIDNPPSPGQIAQAIQQCMSGICAGREAEKYLAAQIMIVEGIDVEEVCALQGDSLASVPGYQGNWCLEIKEIVVQQGDGRRKDRVRDNKHTIESMQPPERRTLGVSKIVSQCWSEYQAKHPEFTADQLLLKNPDNEERVLHPDAFRVWLGEAFGWILPETVLSVGGAAVSTSYEVEDAFWAASNYLLSDLGGYADEELRYHFGKKPLKMDAKHYAGFGAPSELVTMGKMKDKAIAALLGGICHRKPDAKTYQVLGRAGHVSRVHMEIDVAALLRCGFAEKDLLLRLSALGYSQRMRFVEKKD